MPHLAAVTAGARWAARAARAARAPRRPPICGVPGDGARRTASRCFGAVPATAGLTPEQVAAYRRDGYILPGFQFGAPEVDSGRDALNRLLAANPGVMPEQLVNAHLVDGDGSAGGVRGCGEFLSLASHPALVDLVAQCLGTENVILWAVQIFCKLPGEGKSVPFHQDGLYWPIEPLRACSAWIALDASDRENGALQVLPGTHSSGAVEHVQRVDDEACISFVADPGRVAPAMPEAVTLELAPGQVSLHDSMIIHGSERNRSQRRRAGVAATYMPAECLFNREVETEGARKGGIKLDYTRRPLYVVRGRNQNPGNTLLRSL